MIISTYINNRYQALLMYMLVHINIMVSSALQLYWFNETNETNLSFPFVCCIISSPSSLYLFSFCSGDQIGSSSSLSVSSEGSYSSLSLSSLSPGDLQLIEAFKRQRSSISYREILDDLHDVGDLPHVNVSIPVISRAVQNRLPSGQNFFLQKNY